MFLLFEVPTMFLVCYGMWNLVNIVMMEYAITRIPQVVDQVTEQVFSKGNCTEQLISIGELGEVVPPEPFEGEIQGINIEHKLKVREGHCRNVAHRLVQEKGAWLCRCPGSPDARGRPALEALWSPPKPPTTEEEINPYRNNKP